MKKVLFFIILLTLFCFANTFELSLPSKVQTELEIYNDDLYFGCENGDIYSFNALTDTVNWKINIGNKPGDTLRVFQDLLMVSSGNTFYSYYLDNGTLNDMYSFSSDIIGFVLDNETIYLLTNKEINVFSKDFFSIWSKQLTCDKTKPIIDDYFLYFGCGDELYSFDKLNGNLNWKTKVGTPIYIKEGDLRVFIGTADNKIKTYEIIEGKETWDYNAGGWIVDIEDSNGIVFFISNDYYVYAVNADTGVLIWKKQIGDMTDLEVTENIILMGTKDNEIFGLNRDTGEEEFILYTSNWPMNFKIKDKILYYSTLDKKIAYSYIDQVCTFKFPFERSLIGSAVFKVNGTTYSIDNSINKVEIGILDSNAGIYSNTQGIDIWTGYIDPHLFKDGLLDIGCRIYPYEDRGLIKRKIIKTPQNTLLEDMEITYPTKVELQENIQIYAHNKYDRIIKDTIVSYNNKNYQADSNGYITLFFDAPGIKTLEISRKGYKTQSIQIQAGNSQGADDYTLFYLAGIIILIIIIIILIKKIRG